MGAVAAVFAILVWVAITVGMLTVPKADRPEKWPLGALAWPLLLAIVPVAFAWNLCAVALEALREWWRRT